MGASANVQGTGFGIQGSGRPTASPGPLSAGRARGFTLVEMLVVIAIIGILASLITGAAIMAKIRARRAMVRADISQLELALTRYKQEIGEFPPDFANIQSNVLAVQRDAQDAVLRHLRKRFPRYTPTGISGNTYTRDWDRFRDDIRSHYFKDDDNDNTWDSAEACIDPNLFDAASSLVFWLGGMAEQRWPAQWKPAGFHANPQFPFAPGLPRTEPLFTFDPARVLTTNNVSCYCANTDTSTPPYAYFRAQRLMNAAGQYEYGYVESSGGATPTYYFYPLSYPANNLTPLNNWGRAVPYLDGSIPGDPRTYNTLRAWRNQDTFQIVFAGFDNTFGSDEANFRFSKLGQYIARTGGTTTGSPMNAASQEDGNFDNITNFTDDTIEAEMLK